MTGYVDHIIHAAQNAIVAILRLHGAITGEIWPVAPVLTVRVFAILSIVRCDKPLPITPDGLKAPWPRVPDTDVPGFPRPCGDFVAVFVVDDRMNTRHGGARTARLHGLQGRHGATEKASRLCLPPGVHDYRLSLTDDLVIPEPHLRFDGLTHRGHVLEAVVIFRRLIWPGFAQHADRRGGRVEDIDVETLGDAPGTTSIRVSGYAFVHHRGRSEG